MPDVPVLSHRSRPPLAGDAADAADVDPIPEWFSHFLNDRQTRKPSAHTMTRPRGRRPCEIFHRTRSRTRATLGFAEGTHRAPPPERASTFGCAVVPARPAQGATLTLRKQRSPGLYRTARSTLATAPFSDRHQRLAALCNSSAPPKRKGRISAALLRWSCRESNSTHNAPGLQKC